MKMIHALLTLESSALQYIEINDNTRAYVDLHFQRRRWYCELWAVLGDRENQSHPCSLYAVFDLESFFPMKQPC